MTDDTIEHNIEVAEDRIRKIRAARALFTLHGAPEHPSLTAPDFDAVIDYHEAQIRMLRQTQKVLAYGTEQDL